MRLAIKHLGWMPASVLALVALGAAATAAAETVTLFVTSMATDTVNVFRGRPPELTLVQTIRVSREPHNLGLSPGGRWVATGDRRSGEVSVIDTKSLRQVARIRVGRQPHDVAFSADSRTLYVGHEQESYVTVLETGAWTRPPGRLPVGRAQHDLSISPDDRELWFTVTNRPYKPGDPRVGVIELGRYPFHSPKRGRDGNYVAPAAGEMWFSDHGLRAAHALGLADRPVRASVSAGTEPYHVTITPAGTVFVANHRSDSVTVIDGPRGQVLQTLPVPRGPHGLAVLVERP